MYSSSSQMCCCCGQEAQVLRCERQRLWSDGCPLPLTTNWFGVKPNTPPGGIQVARCVDATDGGHSYGAQPPGSSAPPGVFVLLVPCSTTRAIFLSGRDEISVERLFPPVQQLNVTVWLHEG